MNGPTPAPKRILVVDDDPDVREVLRELLCDEGYDVVGAANGMDALRVARSDAPPALILLDLMMPVFNGFDFCQARSRDPRLAQIPLVVVSAIVDRTYEPDGVNAALGKPFDLDDLLDIIDRCFATRDSARTRASTPAGGAHPA